MLNRILLLPSYATAFGRWWTGELRGLIPQRWLLRLTDRRRLLTVDVGSDGSLAILPKHGQPIAVDAGGTGAGLSKLGACHLRVPAAAVLAKRVTLPVAAAARIPEVLHFQIDQETPFRPADVYTDFRLVSQHRKTKRVIVDWRLVRRGIVDEACRAIEARGGQVAAVGIAGQDDDGGNFNFLRVTGETRTGGSGRLRYVLMSVLAGLAIAAVAIPLVEKQAAVRDLNARLAEARRGAEEARELRQRLVTLRETEGFVTDRRLARPTMSFVLKDLTELLPDDSWLTRLTVKGPEISIAGLSPASSVLIGLIEAHPRFEQVAYRSPTMRRADLAVEEFDLSFRMTGEAQP